MVEQVSVIITVNSPGEVSGWLMPFLKVLKQAPLNSSVTVFIPPCTFASGSECAVVRALPEVDRVVEPAEVWHYMLLGQVPPGFRPARKGVVLFLGGDLTWTAWIAKRLHFPVVAYTEGFANWTKNYSWFAQPYPAMMERLVKRGVPEDKLPIVGNLMLDAVQPEMNREEVREKLKLGMRPLLLLMPGSRPAHFEYMVPFLLDVFSQAKKLMPQMEAVFSISPYIGELRLQVALQSSNAHLWGKTGEYQPGKTLLNGKSDMENPSFITLDSGFSVPVFYGRQYDLMTAADLAISLPGTNTMELSFMGVPLIVTIPLLYPEKIPLEGIPGLVGNIPWAGKAIKRWLIPKLSAKIKFTAWPNLLAQENIVPELRGQITASQVGQEVVGLLTDKERSEAISRRLRNITGRQGAAERLVKLMIETLNKCWTQND